MITKFVRKVINRYAQDDCSYMAASLAYYGLFSLFPLTLALVAILGYLLPISTLEEQILRFSEFYLPGSVDLVRANLAHLVMARQSVSIVALIGLLWAATSGVVALTKSLNRVWRAPTPRPFLLQRLLALGLVMTAGLLFFLSISGSAILRFASTIPAPGTGGDMLVDSLLWRITASLLPFVATFLTFLLLYWTIPNVPNGWHTSGLAPLWLVSALRLLRACSGSTSRTYQDTNSSTVRWALSSCYYCGSTYQLLSSFSGRSSQLSLALTEKMNYRLI